MGVITNITSRTLWKRALGYRLLGPYDKAADYTIRASMSGAVFTNRGAGGTVIFTLPSATTGVFFTFVNLANTHQLQVLPVGGGIEMDLNGTWGIQADGVDCYADTLGDQLTIISKGEGDWLSINQTGTWAV